jgi:mannose-6-phosphate isomerase-like protein (cupin superfamily)
MERIDLGQQLGDIHEHWRPRVVAQLNGQEVKLVKFQGEFVWHKHDAEDELFLCLEGEFRMEFRDHVVPLRAGQCLVVPRGVEHRPVAEHEVAVLLFEPAGVRNTGDVVHPTLTAPPAAD